MFPVMFPVDGNRAGMMLRMSCVCPVHVRMPHVTELRSREFLQMMVTDVVVAKSFSR